MSEELPLRDGSNFFGSLFTNLEKKEIAEKFAVQGWSARKATWHDYEVLCEWAELIIEGNEPILFHGPIENPDTNIDRILKTLRDAGIGYSGEYYDETGGLVMEYAWSPDPASR
ncbi:hypothetical protein DES53_102562 [Roseimicrobium gellanilyticum]|uniref:Uncharacterized protein n=1 Tax=Roseimicrobium gellanilyticum TaxID=748857 RepID=A0A366HRQ0_9BACT|nr:hypothetical protein [Roseimicrobium gellanilyticum]RBP46176.1 hypothetical protein DES53_102562 [Roseimicrobium gellanilyticum]